MSGSDVGKKGGECHVQEKVFVCGHKRNKGGFASKRCTHGSEACRRISKLERLKRQQEKYSEFLRTCIATSIVGT